MELRLDHVAIAGRRLSDLTAAFESLGFSVGYGGLHASGATEMAVIPLTDGSYIELIAAADEALLDRSPFWSPEILASTGPCGWCIEVPDVEVEAARLQGLGVRVKGPHAGARMRPDGTEVRWRMAFVGDHGPGALLPFIIEDVTPREIRVPGPEAKDASRLRPTRIAGVVLGVLDLVAAVRLFRVVYGAAEPTYEEPSEWGRLAVFSEIPVVLAAPVTADSWLGERTRQWGPAPCAYVIELESAEVDGPPSMPPPVWGGREITWVDPATACNVRLGFTAAIR